MDLRKHVEHHNSLNVNIYFCVLSIKTCLSCFFVYLKYELREGNGQVKEYSDFGSLRFEGKYLNGLKNGKGKEYRSDTQLEYEGEYLN